MLLKLSLLIFSIALCTAQDYEEYQPEPRSFNSANRYIQAEPEQKTTPAPVAILKQINRHNEDGSYTYGYEAADGSFKIETKAATGEVKGKYGYFDGERVRVVEYGANKHGFQPSGDGITVPPPTFHDGEQEQQYEEERPRQYTVAAKPKYPKQPAIPVQAYNYAAAPEPQQPRQAQPLQYNYDYEQEVATTERPARPAFQFTSSPAPPARPQYFNSIPTDVIYADAPSKPANSFKSQYQPLADRRPPQFPSEDSVQPTPSPIVAAGRADEYSLFSPNADPRGDFYKPKSLAPAPPKQNASPFPSFFSTPRESYQFASQPTPPPQLPPSRPVFQSKPLQQRTTSILDQLAKDYALPKSSSAALHDISFGYAV